MSIEGYARTSTTWDTGGGVHFGEFQIGQGEPVEVSVPDGTYTSTWTTHTVPGCFLNWDGRVFGHGHWAECPSEERPATCDPQPPVDPTDDLCRRISELVNESLEDGWFEQK